jgi:ABC-type uncharacterized transport system involved in gliding motility auxiliary subunit
MPEANANQPHWLVRRGSLVAYLLVVIAVLVLVNYLAANHDKSWDLTKNRTHSLSTESVKIVRGLRHPLDLIYFDKSSSFPAAHEFFSRYVRESNQVHVDYVDPDRHPDQARLYKIQTYGSTVVKSDEHQEIVSTMDEQNVTNAMVRVLKGARKVVYFAEGDGERDPDDSGRDGYSTLKSALEAENFTVQKAVLAQTGNVPADAAALIVAGPTHPLLPAEVTAVQTYLNGGGHVLFLIGPDTSGPLVDYLQASLDVKLSPGIVVDTSGVGRLFNAGPLMVIVAQYDSHPITAQMSQTATLFPDARTVEAAPAPAAAAGAAPPSAAIVSPLLETTAQSLVGTVDKGQVKVDQATDRHGPLTLGVAGTLNSNPEARFVVYGTPDFVANSAISFQGNRDLFLNTMDWLSAQQNFITIRPPAAANAPVNLNAAQMRYVLFIFLLGLPLAVVIIGVAVWWRRRAL